MKTKKFKRQENYGKFKQKKFKILIFSVILFLILSACSNANNSIDNNTGILTPTISPTANIPTPGYRQLLLETKLRPDRKFESLTEVEKSFDKHGLLNKDPISDELNKLFGSNDGANYVVQPGNYPISIIFFNDISKIDKQFWDSARTEVEIDGGYILEYGNILITHELKEFELSMLLADLADSAKSITYPSSN